MNINKLFEKMSADLNTLPENHHGYMLEIRRLNMLENAVINYSGGIDNLLMRLDEELKDRAGMTSFVNKDKNLDLLLRDLYTYLRDISVHLIK